MTSPPLFLVLVSGEHEKIQMAGMMASVAAVSERPVQVFVSMNAIFAFRKNVDADARYRGGAFSKLMKEKNAPDAVTLFEQGKMLGDMKIHPCSMAMDITGWSESELVDGLFDEPLGLTKFLADAEAGQIVVL
jgi:peroxiredoxin family protein